MWFFQFKNSHFKLAIPLETMVVLALPCFGSGFTLCKLVGEVYGIAKSTTSVTGQESFEVIFKHLKSLVFMKLTTLIIKQMTLEFKTLHYVPYIIVQNIHSFCILGIISLL
jgi:hypothetical protein